MPRNDSTDRNPLALFDPTHVILLTDETVTAAETNAGMFVNLTLMSTRLRPQPHNIVNLTTKAAVAIEQVHYTKSRGHLL